MKNFFKYFFALAILITTSAAFIGCSKDDDDDKGLTTGNLIGTWESVETTMNSSGVSETKIYTLNFKSNGTGYRKTEVQYSTGANSSDMWTFRYTVATGTNGVMTVTTIDDDDYSSNTWTVTQTGNTLMVGTRIYKRK